MASSSADHSGGPAFCGTKLHVGGHLCAACAVFLVPPAAIASAAQRGAWAAAAAFNRVNALGALKAADHGWLVSVRRAPMRMCIWLVVRSCALCAK